MNGGSGSQAVVHRNITGMSASGWKAVVHQPDFTSLRLNVRYSRKRPFRLLENHENEGPLSATSGHSND